jgi:SAM-dependent methyltransferase/GNAT superfamily N-acetyltransferase
VIHQRTLTPEDRPRIAALLASLQAFTDDERAVALELVDHRLQHPTSDDYRFILAFAEGGAARLAGYLCYGRTPMTQSTYDLYWIGTSPDFARSGVARGLVASMEAEIGAEGGGLVRVETGSREGHGAAVRFYDGTGFTRAATLPGFYAPGDDLIIFTRQVRGDAGDDAPPADEAALQDAAFGYRDPAGERDFLLACARRFGGREVRRVLAWSCGPGRHLRAFAAVGIAGTGVDASEAMIAHARRLAGGRAAGPEVRFRRGALDARPADGDAPLEPVDLSFVLLSSVHVCATPAALAAHLREAAALLRPGGVHVIEATHPGDLLPTGVHHTEWTEVRGDTTIAARFRMHLDRLGADRVVPVTLDVVALTGKKGAGAATRLHQEDRWFIPDLEGWRAIVAEVPELALVGALGDFNVDVPFEHPAAWRLILVLRRAG